MKAEVYDDEIIIRDGNGDIVERIHLEEIEDRRGLEF